MAAYGTRIALLFTKGHTGESLTRLLGQRHIKILEKIEILKEEDEHYLEQTSQQHEQKAKGTEDVVVEDVVVENIKSPDPVMQETVVAERSYVLNHVKKPKLSLSLEEVVLQHEAAATAGRASTPKNAWKNHNSTFNQAKQQRIRTTNRTPGRRAC
ncbi:uncharacterized protein LOC134815862 [Bolinopsis microptera]|uniref:uncharacterized protein LOC134815862 n=1 Tax=Bolinopsis microptera TaxID=2820187 RepID=UPI0030794429